MYISIDQGKIVPIVVVVSETEPPVIKLPTRAIVGARGAEIEIPGAGLSTCLFAVEHNVCIVRQLSGTLTVNAKAVKEHELVENDRIRLGEARLVYKEATDDPSM
jgi:hypothetical protein